MSSVRHIVLLVVAIALALSAVLAFFSVKTSSTTESADPTDYAPDVFTTWESSDVMIFKGLINDSEVIVLEHMTVLDAELDQGLNSIEWRGGYLVGDALSLNHWEEKPGEMARRWKSEEGVESRLTFKDSTWVLEKSNGEIVVWSSDKNRLQIPELISSQGGTKIDSFSDSSLDIRYDATVTTSEGVFYARKLSDRTAWVFKSTSPSDVAQVATSEEGEVTIEGENLLGVSRNHRTKRDMDILFDSERMVVEAVEAGGSVVWSIEVDETPLGESFEVDLYANRKYQTSFATASAVYVIDVKGNSVKGYPYVPNMGVTGFSVMDYDNNRKFRFLVATGDGGVVNLKGEGKKTSGWGFSKMEGGKSVVHMNHLRVGSKDYIYAGCNDASVLLLKRAGGVRSRTDVEVNPASKPAFRLSSSIGKSTVLFVDEEGWLRELTLGEAVEVGMSGITQADKVEVVDVDSDGKKEVVVYYRGKRTVWNSRNELVE